jgi:Protein of unknown function (DUF3800)
MAVLIDPQMAADDSGNEPQSPVFVLAGFIAPAVQWARFVGEWQSALDLPPKLEYFKMTEAANLGGQFSKRKGWDETKRDDRLAMFVRIIRKYARVRVSAWIRHDDYDKHIKSIPAPARTLAIDSPYVFLLQQLILAIAVWGDQHGIREPCDYFFDEQGAVGDEATNWWPNFKALVQQSERSDLADFVGSPPIFRNEKCFLPLQAADLYAWQIRNHYVQNRRTPTQKIIVPPNRFLASLMSMGAINREYSTPEVLHLREHLLKVGEAYAQAFPDRTLVGPVKDRRKRRKAYRQNRKANAASRPSSRGRSS